MSDIVERLRVDNLLGLPGAGIIGACREAADEIESLRQQLSEVLEVKAAENALWNATYNIQAEQIEKLRHLLNKITEELHAHQIGHDHIVAEKDAENRLIMLNLTQCGEQLAASQAREQQLQEALSDVIWAATERDKKNRIRQFDECINTGRDLLTQPADTTTLEAMITKAGEVMRERCAYEAIRIGSTSCARACKAIRALPSVTLEDLK